MARYARIALLGKAKLGGFEEHTRILSNRDVLQRRGLPPMEREFAARRLRWHQTWARWPDEHLIVIDCVFGGHVFEAAGMGPTREDALRPSASPWLRRIAIGLESVAGIVDDKAWAIEVIAVRPGNCFWDLRADGIDHCYRICGRAARGGHSSGPIRLDTLHPIPRYPWRFSMALGGSGVRFRCGLVRSCVQGCCEFHTQKSTR